jgi:hypothetical protein
MDGLPTAVLLLDKGLLCTCDLCVWWSVVCLFAFITRFDDFAFESRDILFGSGLSRNLIQTVM